MGSNKINHNIKMKLQIFSGLCALAQGYSTQGYFWSNGAPATYSWTDRFGNGMTGWTRSFWNKNRMPRRQMSVNWQQNDNDWNNWMNSGWDNQWVSNNWMSDNWNNNWMSSGNFWCNEWDPD